MPITRREVEMLNIHAENRTRLRYEEGMDYDLWRYSPNHGFSDGHDHGCFGGHPPEEGWEPQVAAVSVPVERLVALVRGITEARTDLDRISQAKTKGVRQSAAFALSCKLDRLHTLLRSPE
jgi:hypothetical protein